MKKLCAAALCGVILLTGCSGNGESSSVPDELIVNSVSDEKEISLFPVEIRGTELTAAAERVVSLSPAVTEILSELGFADKLVGISAYCDYPELNVTAVGSTENPDIDGIIALAPDAVFTLSALSERDVYTLEAAGIAVISLDAPQSMEEYSALYKDIASAFYGKEQTDTDKQTEKAALLGNTARTALETFASGIQLGSFVYVTEKGTLAGSGTFENAVLSLVGENLCTTEGYSASADLAELSPEYIVADSSLSEEDLYADEALAAMLFNGAVPLFVTARCFERPTARTAEIFAEISAQLSEQSATAETE